MARVPYCDRGFCLCRPGSTLARASDGFTLIELLVVITIVGVLAAIALPSFLGQTARARQAGALKYVGAINRTQQMHFLEHAQFASSFEDLGFRPDTALNGYTFTFIVDGGVMSQTQAVPQLPILRGYTGVAFAQVNAQGTARVDTLICKGTVNSTPSPALVEVGGERQVTNCDIY